MAAGLLALVDIARDPNATASAEDANAHTRLASSLASLAAARPLGARLLFRSGGPAIFVAMPSPAASKMVLLTEVGSSFSSGMCTCAVRRS